MDDFRVIYKILSILKNAVGRSDFDTSKIKPQALKISEERWVQYIEMMSDARYIKGVEIHKNICNQVNIDISNISITLKGLEYLQQNTRLKRAVRILRGVKEIAPSELD